VVFGLALYIWENRSSSGNSPMSLKIDGAESGSVVENGKEE
jgi:hypothetical protein